MSEEWEKVLKVKGETFTQQDGRVEFEIVWVLTKKTIYQVSLRRGETMEELVAFYKRRKLTDERCLVHIRR